MNITLKNSIVLVGDVERSKTFYQDILGLTVDKAYDTIVIFKEGLAVHDAKLYSHYIERTYTPMAESNVIFYFTTPNLEEEYLRLKEKKVSFIHGIQVQNWGEKCMRFYDPDGYIIEIGDAV